MGQAIGDMLPLAVGVVDGAKAWLSANNTAVIAVLLLVIGATLFGKGIGALT